MSVNINYVTATLDSKWNNLKTGDFIFIAESNELHPIPVGLYRVFIVNSNNNNAFIVVPMFDGPFPEGLFPYLIQDKPYPFIKDIIQNVHIDVTMS